MLSKKSSMKKKNWNKIQFNINWTYLYREQKYQTYGFLKELTICLNLLLLGYVCSKKHDHERTLTSLDLAAGKARKFKFIVE